MNYLKNLEIVRSPPSKKNSWIQAVRGICVLAVLFFHYNPQTFAYGYLGVDVFFAISGYLLVPKIHLALAGRETSRNDVKIFIRKRFNRLLPAFLVFLIVSVTTVFLFGHPENLNDVLAMSSAGALGLANFGAYRFVGDYFSPNINPLIHIWSLSAEIQCYFLCIVIFFFLNRSRKILRDVLIITSALIIINVLTIYFPQIYAVAGFSNGSAFGYYSPNFRFLEFMLGGLLSLRFNNTRVKTHLFIIGLLVSLIYFLRPSPISIGIAVSLATGFLLRIEIVSSKVTRILFPLTWIGNGSYSIYLYHLPVLYFLDLYLSGILKPFLYFTLSIVLGYLSYSKVELLRIKVKSKLILKLQIATGLLIIICGIISAHSYFGMLKSVTTPPYAGSTKFQVNSFMNKHCIKTSPCLPASNRIDGETILLIGDSHAEMLSESFASLSILNRSNLEIWTSPGCRFVLKATSQLDNTNDCAKKNLKLFAYISLHRPDRIILSQAIYRDSNLREMEYGVKQLTQLDIPLILLGAIPIFPDDQRFMKIPPLISISVNSPKAVNRSDMDLSNEQARIDFEQYSRDLGVKVIDLSSRFCNEKKCFRFMSGKWLYFDNSHLSSFGGRYLEDYLSVEIFSRKL